jgi:hypothetical protein
MADISFAMVTEHGGHRVLFVADDVHFETPPVEHLAFYAGLGGLVALGLIELPMALALTVGHLLIGITNRPGLEALGEALTEV